MSVSMDRDDVRGDIATEVSAQIQVAITKQIRPPMAEPLKGLLRILIGLPAAATSAFSNWQTPTSSELRGGRQFDRILSPQFKQIHESEVLKTPSKH